MRYWIVTQIKGGDPLPGSSIQINLSAQVPGIFTVATAGGGPKHAG